MSCRCRVFQRGGFLDFCGQRCWDVHPACLDYDGRERPASLTFPHVCPTTATSSRRRRLLGAPEFPYLVVGFHSWSSLIFRILVVIIDPKLSPPNEVARADPELSLIFRIYSWELTLGRPSFLGFSLGSRFLSVVIPPT